MAQSTDVEATPNPPVEKPAPAETHSASPPPPSYAENFMRTRPRARMYLVGAILVLLVGGYFAWRYITSY